MSELYIPGEGNAPQQESEQVQESEQKGLSLGLSPMGNIVVTITDESGVHSYPIQDPGEAWQFAGHLSALATMQVQSYYAAAVQEKVAMQQILQGIK